MHSSLTEKDLAYFGIGEDAGKKRHCRPELFVWYPT